MTLTFSPVPSNLICPACNARLIESERGTHLGCNDCGGQVAIRGGIPRFVAQEHLESFGWQWTRYEVAHEDEDRATFLAKTGVAVEDLAGLRVLDAGCGGGRYTRLLAEAGVEVVGTDHSEAVEKARTLCDGLPNATFLQADLKNLPFPDGSFDFVFSIGVMHHDADTRAVFDAVARMVRPGGRYSVWLYRRNTFIQEAVNRALRRRTVIMPHEKLERWCRRAATLGGIPVLNRLLNKVVNFSNHPVYENRVCDTFDWYAPEYQHHHTIAELEVWFQQAGFNEIRILPPEKTGRIYRLAYALSLIVGSGVNIQGTRIG